MKVLWVKADFLHPTTKGGQIRTLQMLKRLHSRHEIHYAALDLSSQPGGVEHSGEYCTSVYPIPHYAPANSSPSFWLQAAQNMFSDVPLVINRYRSPRLRLRVEELLRHERFDAVVGDFLSAAQYIPDLTRAVLFQHNVEAQIWKRRLEHASGANRLYILGQYQKMHRYEGEVCRAVKRVIAVSKQDAEAMRSDYGVRCVHAVPTGVDVDYFSPPDSTRRADLLFVGSMDWAPNVDALQWFVREVFPRIRIRRPACSLTIAGRRPDAAIRKLAATFSGIRVTGTVDDVRPYLWEAAVSIVPLRIGGGTRLKIFEAMAAQVPVVSTTIGAEGLEVRNGETIRIADSPEEFAEHCLDLLAHTAGARTMAEAAWQMVSSCYSWEVASREFERLLT